VAVGSSKTISWSINWALDLVADESFVETSRAFSGGIEPFEYEFTNLNCRDAGFHCVYDPTFAPTEQGKKSETFLSFLTISTRLYLGPKNYVDSDFDYNLMVTGNGISAVPLPAGLPLLLAGLGALGFAGRRKRRS
jgi:hypothetical protein